MGRICRHTFPVWSRSRAGRAGCWCRRVSRQSYSEIAWRLAPFPYSLVPFSPNPLYRIPSARILILIRWHRPPAGRASELHFTYPAVLDPETPLCKSLIAARKSCGPCRKSETHPSAREKTDGARPG